MWRAQVIDTWETVEVDGPAGKESITRPKLAGRLGAGESLADASGEAAPVNTPENTPVLVELCCGLATLEGIRASAEYGEGAILWQEEAR